MARRQHGDRVRKAEHVGHGVDARGRVQRHRHEAAEHRRVLRHVELHHRDAARHQALSDQRHCRRLEIGLAQVGAVAIVAAVVVIAAGRVAAHDRAQQRPRSRLDLGVAPPLEATLELAGRGARTASQASAIGVQAQRGQHGGGRRARALDRRRVDLPVGRLAEQLVRRLVLGRRVARGAARPAVARHAVVELLGAAAAHHAVVAGQDLGGALEARDHAPQPRVVHGQRRLVRLPSLLQPPRHQQPHRRQGGHCDANVWPHGASLVMVLQHRVCVAWCVRARANE